MSARMYGRMFGHSSVIRLCLYGPFKGRTDIRDRQGGTIVTSKGIGPKQDSFTVILRPERGQDDDAAVRCLKAFLKAALRSYGLRAISVERTVVVDDSRPPGASSRDQGHST